MLLTALEVVTEITEKPYRLEMLPKWMLTASNAMVLWFEWSLHDSSPSAHKEYYTNAVQVTYRTHTHQ